jgi:hypothetical protein
MQVTVNSDCSVITFTSTNFTNSLDGLELRAKYNLAATPTVFNLNSKISGISGNFFTLSPTEYHYPAGLPSGTTAPTKFCDGVFYFEVESSVVTDVGPPIVENSVTESSCTFVSCETRCALVENYKNENIDEMLSLYESIKNGQDCDDCNCTKTTNMFLDLKDMLNLINSSTNVNDCGC